MILYLLIFLAKVLENALSTIRLIVVAHNKKILGAVLQFIVILIWLLVAGTVLVNISEDVYKIVAYAVGSMVGSYVGSLIEEQLALGNNSLMAIVDIKLSDLICDTLRSHGYAVTSVIGKGRNEERSILYVIVSRKKRSDVTKIIDTIDSNSMIITETVSTIKGGYII